MAAGAGGGLQHDAAFFDSQLVYHRVADHGLVFTIRRERQRQVLVVTLNPHLRLHQGFAVEGWQFERIDHIWRAIGDGELVSVFGYQLTRDHLIAFADRVNQTQRPQRRRVHIQMLVTQSHHNPKKKEMPDTKSRISGP